MILETLILCSLTFYLLYKYFNRNYDYWEKKGIPYLKPKFFFGNYYEIMVFRKNIGVKLREMYNEMSGPYFGIWVFSTPFLIVKSPEMIKNILVKDFKYFFDRTIASNEKADEMSSYVLFMLKNPEWKTMRSKMTPAFTSGKIKSMIPIINKSGSDVVAYIENLIQKGDILEAKEICAKYSTDVITACAFGVEGNSFKNDKAIWRSIGKDMFDFSITNGVRATSYFFFPELVDLLKLKFIPPHITTFLRDAFWQTIRTRENDNVSRNDVIDIIMKLRLENDLDGVKFEGDKVVAQAVQFFLAGFETVSSTIAHTLYELCLNKAIQNQLVSEIESTFKDYDNVTYEEVQNMKYLHKIVQETLRKYPVLPFLDRRCVMDYKIPDTEIILEKGTPVYIPMLGLHYDPQYFPNPEVFDPERFTEENINSRPTFAYIPFGTGPHNCIGERIGLITTKTALVRILSKFEVERCSETPFPIVFEPKSFVLASTIGLPMRFIKRQVFTK